LVVTADAPEPLLEPDFDSDPHAVSTTDVAAIIARAAPECPHRLIELSSTPLV
jgi:hypothetical protein